ncbi:hypothetical protein BVX97_04060 [bacterium E08(2017)]|nr:hypothetical protein BVX97_04060 [bacterium E08(2017)]
MIDIEIRKPSDISCQDKLKMYQLMGQYYHGVNRTQFDKDLLDKQNVITLHHNRDICGFSTQAIWNLTYDDIEFKVVFSGDTIVDRSKRATTGLPFAFARFLFSEYDQNRNKPLYWLLTSKGYKTYHAMTTFFYRYFPSRNGNESEEEMRVLQKIMAQKFNGNLDKTNWVLKAKADSQRLRICHDEFSPCSKRTPGLEFFEKMNPGHQNGDELVCFARFCETNIKRQLWRRLFE